MRSHEGFKKKKLMQEHALYLIEYVFKRKYSLDPAKRKVVITVNFSELCNAMKKSNFIDSETKTITNRQQKKQFTDILNPLFYFLIDEGVLRNVKINDKTQKVSFYFA